MRRGLLFLGLGLSILACSRMEIEQEPKQTISEEICFTAYADVQTKTERQGDGSVFWNPGDAVSLFFNQGDNGGNRFVAQNTEVSAIAEFKGTITGFAGGGESTGGEFWFWGVYPYSENNSCDGTSVTLTLPAQQTARAGSFANGLFPTMARSQGLSLGFYNICGGFKFTVSRDDIKAVKFRGNANEDLAGKAKVVWDSNGHPAVSEHLVGDKEITVTAPDNGTFVPGIEYYIVFYPELLSEGFTLTFITSASKQGSFSYSSSRQLKRGIFVNGSNLDTYVTTWTDAENTSGQNPSVTEGGTESGLYFGLSTFDRYYQYYPIKLISEEALEDYHSTINSLELTTLNGTLLLYSCDEDITAMRRVSLPSDLTTVSLVTFTDGFDQGSRNYHRDLYSNDNEYLDAVNYRLLNETIGDVPIKSYAIGLKGTDALSDLDAFRDWLRKLASTPKNSSEKYVYEIDWDNFNDLSDAFAKIAEELSESIKLYNVRVHFPLVGDGDRVRITFDINNPKNTNARMSNWYIEGIYDDTNLLLHDIEYHGFDGNLPTTIHDSGYDGFELYFNFDGLHPSSDAEIVETNILTWRYNTSTSTWTPNSETTQGALPEINTIHSSALVLLNLDLSRSLEGKLPDLKRYSKQFVSTLYSSSVDPDVIKRVRLNMTSMDLIIGQNETIQATISPSTASGNTLVWSSAIPSVATVDQNGKVTAVSEGTTIISVSTEDGKEMATCLVTVRFQHVESVSLDKANLQMYVGKTATLVATVFPSNANNPAVTWTSSNSDVAIVNENGLVTAISEGSAIITASSVDGNKTATCALDVTNFIPSTIPTDLTLAVSTPSGVRYFLKQADLQYVNLDNYIVEGLYTVGLSGFIIALEDATSTATRFDAANSFFRLPDGDQGMSISARFSDINDALRAFGGQPFRSYQNTFSNDCYYWTSEQASKTSHKCFRESGGALYNISDTEEYLVREVVPLSYEAPWTPITSTSGLFLSVSNGVSRQFLSTSGNIPEGYLPEGIAIASKSDNIIIGLSDASSTGMNYSAAAAIYGTKLPNQNQAKLISARFNDINRALSSFGGQQIRCYQITYSYHNYYWTSAQDGTSSHKCFDGSGGALQSISDTETNFVRLIVGTF